jgi:hypothetical protein
MGRNDKTTSQPKPVDKPRPAAPTDADDDFEDGDMATPKRDRDGTDDEPLQ